MTFSGIKREFSTAKSNAETFLPDLRKELNQREKTKQRMRWFVALLVIGSFLFQGCYCFVDRNGEYFPSTRYAWSSRQGFIFPDLHTVGDGVIFTGAIIPVAGWVTLVPAGYVLNAAECCVVAPAWDILAIPYDLTKRPAYLERKRKGKESMDIRHLLQNNFGVALSDERFFASTNTLQKQQLCEWLKHCGEKSMSANHIDQTLRRIRDNPMLLEEMATLGRQRNFSAESIVSVAESAVAHKNDEFTAGYKTILTGIIDNDLMPDTQMEALKNEGICQDAINRAYERKARKEARRIEKEKREAEAQKQREIAERKRAEFMEHRKDAIENTGYGKYRHFYELLVYCDEDQSRLFLLDGAEVRVEVKEFIASRTNTLNQKRNDIVKSLQMYESSLSQNDKTTFEELRQKEIEYGVWPHQSDYLTKLKSKNFQVREYESRINGYYRQIPRYRRKPIFDRSRRQSDLEKFFGKPGTYSDTQEESDSKRMANEIISNYYEIGEANLIVLKRESLEHYR